jgi:hypothetical protein
MERKWISDFAGIGYRYTDIIMNILILYTDRKTAMKMWNQNIRRWSDVQIILRFVEEKDEYWFILYQRGNNLHSKDNIGFLKKNPLTDNYLRFKKNFDQNTVLRFAIYKSQEEKTADKQNTLEGKDNDSSNRPTFELDIFKSFKTIYDVKFLKSYELEENSLERSLLDSIDFQKYL